MVSGPASRAAGCGPVPFQRVTVPAPDGLHLSVRVGGAGPAILLVHGFTGDSTAWGDDLLSSLARRHRVVVPDLVGHGESAKPHDPRRYQMERVLEDLATVQEAVARGPAAWVGYSMGGRVALAAAVLGAAPMACLVLESASPGLSDAVERRSRIEADEARAAELLAGDLEDFVDRWMAQPLFRTQRFLPADVRARERRRRLAQDPRALAACLRGLGTGVQPSMWEGLPGVGTPTFLLTGGRDEKFDALARAMLALLPQAWHHSVAEAGHAVHLEAPEAWNEAVEGFVQRHLGG